MSELENVSCVSDYFSFWEADWEIEMLAPRRNA